MERRGTDDMASTHDQRKTRQAGGTGASAAPSEPLSAFRPAHLFFVLTLVAASAVAIRAQGTRPENVIFLALIVGAVGLTAYAVYRTLWPLISPEGEQAGDMLGGRTRAALEQEKALTLRAIKDLEFDRRLKKVSDSDCDELTARLRERAIRIIKQLDAGSAAYREVIERELSARRVAEGLPASAPVAATPPGGISAAGEPGVGCPTCGTSNEADARFCKSCGGRVGGAA